MNNTRGNNNNQDQNQMGMGMMGGAMPQMFMKISPGLCKLTLQGGIAIKTSSGYKYYNVKTKSLTNCNNFVFQYMDNMFFTLPTNKVSVGDVIIVGGKPKCVIECVSKDRVKVLNYENSIEETLVPERHIILGRQYFYSKIATFFGSGATIGKDKKGMKGMAKMMMALSLLGNNGQNQQGIAQNAPNGQQDGIPGMMMGGMDMGNMLPLMMMFGGGDDMFSGLSDMFDEEDDEDALPTDIDEGEDD